MMEEVAGDDTNGESTFEFVSDKLAAFDLSTVETDKTHESSNEPSKLPLSIPSSVPPPAALPSFISENNSSSVPMFTSSPKTVISATLASMPATSKTPSTSESVIGAQRKYPSTPYPSIPMYSSPTTPNIPAYSPTQASVYSLGSYSSPANPQIFTPFSPVVDSTSMSVPVYESQSSPYMTTPTVQTSAAIDLPLDYSQNYQMPPEINSGGNNAGGMWEWFKDAVTGSELLTKVAEKAKNSVDSMITTLDPQMKEYIRSGGNIDVLVTSDKDVKVKPIRDAFQQVFNRATVSGHSAQANIAPQPVGFTAGLKGAEERIQALRRSGRIDPQQVVASLENFIVELTPDKWYDIGCLILDDPVYQINLIMYTQATPIPIEYIQQAQDETPPDYPLRWSGLAVTIGQIIERHLPNVHHTEWHSGIAGVSRRDLIYTAATALASMYQKKISHLT